MSQPSSPEKRQPTRTNNVCLACRITTVTSKQDPGFKCNVCLLKIHYKCTNMDQGMIDLFRGLQQKGKETYTCYVCESASKNLNARVDLNAKDILALEKKNEALEKRVEKIEEELENQKKLGAEFGARLAEVEKNKSTNGGDIDTDKISNDVLREMSDRKYRSKNLIIQGVKEVGKDKDDTIEKDAQEIIKIFGHLNLDPPSQESLKKTARLGNHTNGKIRPIKLILSDNNQVDQVLSKSAKLNEGSFKQIRIERDLTKGQRGAEAKIWEECQSKNRVGREELQIRKKAFKVVGRKGRKRIVELPLRDNERITEEGKVILERRDSVASVDSTARRDSILDFASPARDNGKRNRSDGSTPGSNAKKSQKVD